MAGFDAVILVGGTGRRLGGVDKGGLVVAGQSLLDRVLLAAVAARHTVVVGEARPTVREVCWTREEPPGGGPLAGLAAGLSELDRIAQSDDEQLPVIVLATDLPWLRPADLDRLLTALADDPAAEAAVFSDPEGRLQPLAAAYRIRPIRVALAAVRPVHGKPVKLVLHALAVVTVPDLGAAGDCDTPDQLAAARAHFDRQG
jgi:molybdopterin-guanine dinucleotide biosynthesis protein A